MLKGAMAELSITPLLGRMIPGQFIARWSKGVLDELYVKALVLDNGGRRITLISTDALGVHEETVREIRRLSGLPELVVAATHTHTGGPVENWGHHIKEDPEYLRWFAQRCADCVRITSERLEPVTLSVGTGEESKIAFHRRFLMKDGSIRTNPGVGNPDIVRPAGPIDPALTVLRVDAADRTLGTVTCFSCHCDTVGTREERLCGDYPGELSRRLKRSLGDQAVSLFLLAPCGNINHVDVTGKFNYKSEHYRKLGRILAQDVLRALETARPMASDALGVSSETLTLGLRTPTAEYVEQAKKTIAEITEPHEELARLRDGRLEQLFYAHEAVRMWEHPETSCRLEVQTLRIGELGVAALPVELFVEFGLELREKSPSAYTMVSTQTNGSYGYVPTPEALDCGGYESMLCSSARLEREAGSSLVTSALSQLTALFTK